MAACLWKVLARAGEAVWHRVWDFRGERVETSDDTDANSATTEGFGPAGKVKIGWSFEE
jgi:hypothetical protein